MSSERAATPRLDSRAERFTYIPSGDGSNSQGENGGVADWNGAGWGSERALEQREKAGYERGVLEGEARKAMAYEKDLSSARSAIARAVEEFKHERELYFGRIEPEVVQLALSIARKILHREAQMDPLLLTGMVHVALEKLDQGAGVRLRAHPEEIHFWNAHFSDCAAARIAPEIVGDSGLGRGECALETEVGHTQISLDLQLKEIEQGFFDLLEQRPQVR